MFKPVMPSPPAEGPQVPVQNPVPPMPTHAPIVILPVPAGAQPPTMPDAASPQAKGKLGQVGDRGRAAFEAQRPTVAARVRGWFAAADVTDGDLGQAVTNRKLRAQQAEGEHLIREVGRLRAKMVTAQAAEAHEQGDRRATSAQVERLRGELAAAEVRVESHVPDMVMPPTAGEIKRARFAKQASRAAIIAASVIGWSKGVMVDPALVGGVTVAGVPVGWLWLVHTAEDEAEQAAAPVSLVKSESPSGPAGAAASASSSFGGPGSDTPAFDAPPPPALSEEALTEALRTIGLVRAKDQVTMLAAPAWGADMTATTVFDLPGYVTVKKVQDKVEDLAGALGRDVTMIDVSKAGAAGRCSLWMSDEDPFERPRSSPLLMHKGGVDAWRDGIPVAWAKRGNTVALPIRDSHFLVAGMTRSGKGVGAANLVAGSSLDVRINLRIVAGKTNGEFDCYAKSGVAATYFKQTPTRVLALGKALKADMNRRNAILGELGKSKLTPEAIERLGGIELVIIDELATFTRPGRHPDRDELLEDLIELAAVATGAGIFLMVITQYPEADVVPQGLATNFGTRWAMRVDNAIQSNAILGGGASGSSGRDASKFDPPRPGLGWLVNPFAGVTDLARSFDLDEDERGEVTQILSRAADLRNAAGRLVGQWEDPIEKHLVNSTGLSSAGGGPAGNGVPGKARTLTAQEQVERDVLVAALRVMDELGRDAQLDEMAARIGVGMTAERLGELLRAAGAGGTVKITVPHKAGRVNGYQRADVKGALKLLQGT